MLELAIGSSLIHPHAFGAAWIGLVLLCGWKVAQQRVFKGEFGFTSTPVRVWLLAFGPLLTITIISVIVHRLSLSRVEVLEMVVGGALLAAGLPLIMIRSKHIGWAAAVAGVGAATVAVLDLAVLQHQRAGEGFHPINYGMGCGIVLIMLVVWWKFRNQVFQGPAIALGVGLIAALASLLASGSRGPILAFLMCTVIASLWWARHSRQSMRRAVVGLTLLGLVAAAIFHQRVNLELSTGDLTSHGIRWQLIQIAIEQIQKTPLLGIGADQAGKLFAQFPEPIQRLNHAHVTILNAALELGVFGGAAWLWASGILGWFFWQQRKRAPAALWQAGLLLTLFIFLCSMTQDILSHTYTRRVLALALVLFMVMCTENSKEST